MTLVALSAAYGACAHDQDAVGSGLLDRLLESFALGDTGAAAPLPGRLPIAQDFRIACEQVIAEQASPGTTAPTSTTRRSTTWF